MTEPVRFAVVGAMGYSRSHLQGVRRLSDHGLGRLVASTMIDKAEHPELVLEFEQAGVQVFEDYWQMLAECRERVDVVTLPVPIHLHAPMTIAALEAGYHVLVEKPAAGCLSDVDDMIDAREASGRQCVVGFQQIYSPVIQALKQRIVQGRLGRVRRIRMMALWPRTPAYYGRNDWAGRILCGGRPVYDSPFNNALAHQVMNMLYLASPEADHAAAPAHVEAELFRAYDIESFDTGCMRVRTGSHVDLVFAASHACATNVDPQMALEADEATVDWQLGREAVITYTDGRAETLPWSSPQEGLFHSILRVATGAAQQPLCTLEIARVQVACTEAIHEAGTILDAPGALVSELPGGQRVIDGVHEAVGQVFETGRLFSELGAPFASPLSRSRSRAT